MSLQRGCASRNTRRNLRFGVSEKVVGWLFGCCHCLYAQRLVGGGNETEERASQRGLAERISLEIPTLAHPGHMIRKCGGIPSPTAAVRGFSALVK